MADPFASLVRQCIYSDSQADRLRHCQFCRASEEDLPYLPCEESPVLAGVPAASTGIMICSLSESLIDKETLREEEFQTPEERLLVSSQEQEMNLDENVDPKVDVVGGNCGAIESVAPDLAGTVDLGKDADIVFSGEKSPPEKGFSIPRTGGVDGVHASKVPSGGSCENKVLECKSKISKRKSIAREDLGFPESKGECSVEFLYENSRNSRKKFHFDDVVDDADTCAGGCVEQTSKFLTEKNLEFLKSKCDSPCKSSCKSPNIPQKTSTGLYKTNENVVVTRASPGSKGEARLTNSKGDSLVIHPGKILVLEPGDNHGASERGMETTKKNSPLKSIEDVHPRTDEEHNDQRGNPISRHTEKLGPIGFRRLPKWADGVAENAIGGSVSGGRRAAELQVSSRDRRRMGECQGLDPGRRKNSEPSPSENMPQSFMNLIDIINRIRDGKNRIGGSDGLGTGEKKTVVEAPSSVNLPQPIIDLLDSICEPSKEVDQSMGDVDILEVAERAGENFPRPRWWRHEGY